MAVLSIYPPRGADRKPAKVIEEFLKLKADNTAWVEETRKRLSSLGCVLVRIIHNPKSNF